MSCSTHPPNQPRSVLHSPHKATAIPPGSPQNKVTPSWPFRGAGDETMRVMEVPCRAVTADLFRTKWLIHAERSVDQNPHIQLSIATVELPDAMVFDQYVMRMRRAAMTVVLDEARTRTP